MWRLRPKRECPELRDLLKSLSSGAHRDANLIKQRQWTCKPNSVFRLRGVTVIPLGGTLLPRSCDLPGGSNAPSRCVSAEAGSLPIWSCSVWGLPCPEHCCPGGALLPHLFTLTTACAGRYVFCGTGRLPALTLEARTLSGTLLCGVRTFLPGEPGRPSGPLASHLIIAKPFPLIMKAGWRACCIVFGH